MLFLLISCAIELSPETIKSAEKNGFEVHGFSFRAQKEELRLPRIVRVIIFLKLVNCECASINIVSR